MKRHGKDQEGPAPTKKLKSEVKEEEQERLFREVFYYVERQKFLKFII